MDQERHRPERSHYLRVPAPWVAGCSDTGRRHPTNQDALCLAVRPDQPPSAVLAVADGVSTTSGSEAASLAAAETAVSTLVAARRAGDSPSAALHRTFAAAQSAVLATQDEAAACTLITALVEDGVITVGNVGDSRAYWVGDDGTARLLSTDDSLAQARIMLGMTRDDAEQSAQAHAITKWLGGNSADVTPSIESTDIPGAGWLVLCSDGLWNYASEPAALGALVTDRVATVTDAASLAEALVDWANAQGGKDNITVAVARLGPLPGSLE